MELFQRLYAFDNFKLIKIDLSLRFAEGSAGPQTLDVQNLPPV